MNGKKAKAIKRIAVKEFQRRGNPKSGIFKTENGMLLHPGDSLHGIYLEFKKRYKSLKKAGERPHLSINRGIMP